MRQPSVALAGLQARPVGWVELRLVWCSEEPYSECLSHLCGVSVLGQCIHGPRTYGGLPEGTWMGHQERWG